MRTQQSRLDTDGTRNLQSWPAPPPLGLSPNISQPDWGGEELVDGSGGSPGLAGEETQIQ